MSYTYLQGENQLTHAVFQTVKPSEMKIMLWQAQVTASNFMHFDMLAKHSFVNSKKYVAILSILIKELENRFQECWKNQFFGIFATPCTAEVNVLAANFQMGCTELQSFNSKFWCLDQFYKTSYQGKTPLNSQSRLIHAIAFCIFVYNYFRGWITGRVKLDQKHLISTMRTH